MRGKMKLEMTEVAPLALKIRTREMQQKVWVAVKELKFKML